MYHGSGVSGSRGLRLGTCSTARVLVAVGTVIRLLAGSSTAQSTRLSAGELMSGQSVSETAQYVACGSGGGSVFVYDRIAGAALAVDVDSNGTPADQGTGWRTGPGGHGIALSRRGRFVAFHSWATNLVSGDTNDQPDIFVHDRDFDSDLAFDEALPGELRTVRINVTSNGTQAAGTYINGSFSSMPVISADGRTVAFIATDGTQLVTGDTNGFLDVFVHDRDPDGNGVLDEAFAGGRRTTRISIPAVGGQPNSHCTHPSISADGVHIVFDSSATNLLGADANGVMDDVYAYDRDADGDRRLDGTAAGATSLTLVSVSTAGVQSDGYSFAEYGGAVSADGACIVFTSDATDLVLGDSNGVADVFVRDRDPDRNGILDETAPACRVPVTVRVSVSSTGGESTAGAANAVISPDGRFVLMQSCAQGDLAQLPPFSGPGTRVYLHDRDADGNGAFDETSAGARSTVLLDLVIGCPPPPGPPPVSSLAAFGRAAAFTKGASNSSPTVWAQDVLPDIDGDGLLDTWETNGIDADADGAIDLTLANANPNRKDLYIEVDGMPGRMPSAQGGWRPALITAFANAPVDNPDGSTGITLHLDLDESNIPLATWTWPPPNPPACGAGSGFPPEFATIKAARFGTPAERANANWANIRAAKRMAYRYCIFGDRLGTTTISGQGELPGNDFYVTLGAWQTPGGTLAQQQGLFLHELGHSLGLGHGGARTDALNYKPNFHDVLNYTWTVPSLSNIGCYGNSWQLDYQAARWNDLDESGLSEAAGISAAGHATHCVPFNSGWAWEVGSVDWNSNGSFDAQLVSRDINWLAGGQSPGEYLVSFDSWSNLRLPISGHPNFANGVSGYATPQDELTFEIVQTLARLDGCDVPLTENFDTYPSGAPMHGLGGWKGWDNNPATTAFVSQDQSSSPPQAVEISGAADLVHEFCNTGEGLWTVEADQYIPGNFSSNAAGSFAGSYLIVMNTYADNEPHLAGHWSVQIQFDSNDRMMKVFHGDGINRIQRPYVPDRWVRIKALIDLDEDWTRIYYDDALVTEYTWTGGVLGGGGGSYDIAAIDVYANGASAVYYDNILIEQVSPSPCEPCDTNCDGSVNAFDIQSFVDALNPSPATPCSPCAADTNSDGSINTFDIQGFVECLGG